MGTPAAPGRAPLVLVHGVGLDHTVWDPLRDLVGRDRRVLVPELLGHGSRGPAPEDVSLADLGSDLATSIPPGSHLVGFSLGALVAQWVALNRPELVASLTLVSSVFERTTDERAAVTARLARAAEDFASGADAALARWFDGTDVPTSTVEHTREVLLANDVVSYVRCYRVFATADAELADQLSTLDLPVLAITGEDDPGSTAAMTRALAAAVPGCRAEVLPGVRHMLPLQAPHHLHRSLLELIGGTAHV